MKRKGTRTFWEHGVMPMEKQNKSMRLATKLRVIPESSIKIQKQRAKIKAV